MMKEGGYPFGGSSENIETMREIPINELVSGAADEWNAFKEVYKEMAEFYEAGTMSPEKAQDMDQYFDTLAIGLRNHVEFAKKEIRDRVESYDERKPLISTLDEIYNEISNITSKEVSANPEGIQSRPFKKIEAWKK
ncbi:MAG: hypothetical protein AAB870_00495 [Patescibacteria group bacterium]